VHAGEPGIHSKELATPGRAPRIESSYSIFRIDCMNYDKG
jgi:hypothetical protein